MRDILLNNLLYANEHLNCKNYVTDVDTGFRYLEFPADTRIREYKAGRNSIICMLDGQCIINCNLFKGRRLLSEEMVLIPRNSLVDGVMVSACKMLIFSFGVIKNPCDISMLRSYYECNRNIVYDFSPIRIRHPLTGFIDLLVYCLKNGMNCAHLHELKHKEFFLFLRAFYTKEEVVKLLYPIMGNSIEFRDLILRNYIEAKNVDDLIQLFPMSRNTFYNKFVKEFQMTPKQWMLKQLKQQVSTKAATPDITIKDLMEQFNFDSPSHFNRFCLREFNCTPGELIKQNQ